MRMTHRIWAAILGLLAISPHAYSSPASLGSIEGKVTDLFGRSISSAKVEVMWPQLPGINRLSTVSDKNGAYKLLSVRQGDITISVISPGFHEEQRSFYLSPGEKRILNVGLRVGELTDFPSLKVTGAVHSTNGVAMRNADVTIMNCFNEQLGKQVKTDHEGKYQVELSRAGQYLVYASAPGFSVAVTTLVLRGVPNESHEINLSLSPMREPSNP
ncbi:MAG TPA: carboxypeptidase-like regulatory domain-containing protein [Terriglobales bacterium]|nr:carboxypeptidase-like regulatory domain-containing protein [Terriglobales bacterium]